MLKIITMNKKKTIITAAMLSLAGTMMGQNLFEVTSIIYETPKTIDITSKDLIKTDLWIDDDSVYFWQGIGEHGKMVQTSVVSTDITTFKEGDNYEGVPFELTVKLEDELRVTYLLYDLQNQYE